MKGEEREKRKGEWVEFRSKREGKVGHCQEVCGKTMRPPRLHYKCPGKKWPTIKAHSHFIYGTLVKLPWLLKKGNVATIYHRWLRIYSVDCKMVTWHSIIKKSITYSSRYFFSFFFFLPFPTFFLSFFFFFFGTKLLLRKCWPVVHNTFVLILSVCTVKLGKCPLSK